MQKSQLFPVAFFILFTLNLAGQRYLVREGEYEIPQNSECLSEKQRLQIRNELEANVRMLHQQGKLDLNPSGNPVHFEFPMQWNIPMDAHDFYVISSYVDHDPAYPGFLEDYNCGDRSYDTGNGYNHKGIDFLLWPFQWNMMDAEAVKIVAAADGVIIGKYEGYDDRSCIFNTNQWNAVYLRHADGSRSWYGHMKKNSVTTKAIGESVVAGDYLGLVGSSGNSLNPHLHFEVYNADDDLIDPYAGPCNMWNEESWWIDQRPYIDPALLRIQTHFSPPVINECPLPAVINDQNEFQAGDSIYFAAYIRDQQNFHLGEITILTPAGEVYDEWSFNSTDTFIRSASWIWGDALPSDATEGKWMYVFEFLGNVYSYEFFVGEVSSVANGNELVQNFSIKSEPNDITVLVNCIQRFEGIISLTGLSGKIIEQVSYDFNQGSNIIRMNTEKLPPGLYMVSLASGNGTFLKTEKFFR